MLMDMKGSKNISAKASNTIADRLVWQTAHKDQPGISKDLMSQPLMHLAGFNGRQVRQGTSSSGLSKDGELARKNHTLFEREPTGRTQ